MSNANLKPEWAELEQTMSEYATGEDRKLHRAVFNALKTAFGYEGQPDPVKVQVTLRNDRGGAGFTHPLYLNDYFWDIPWGGPWVDYFETAGDIWTQYDEVPEEGEVPLELIERISYRGVAVYQKAA